MSDNRRSMLLHDVIETMATDSSDEPSEDPEQLDREDLVRIFVKRDMERHADIYEDLEKE